MEFSNLFEFNFKKLDESYLNLILERHYNSCPIPNMSIKQYSIDEFVNQIKNIFLSGIQNGHIKSSFKKLHKTLPLLAEYILIDCYEKRILPKNQFGDVFREIYIWKRTEKNESLFPEKIGNQKLLELFMYCHKQKIITTKDKNLLSDFQIIYRGTAGRTFEEAQNAISWTTDKKVAEKFMNDYKRIFNLKDGLIISGYANKTDIIAYFREDRYENEIIINPKNIKNIKILN